MSLEPSLIKQYLTGVIYFNSKTVGRTGQSVSDPSVFVNKIWWGSSPQYLSDSSVCKEPLPNGLNSANFPKKNTSTILQKIFPVYPLLK